MNLIKKIALASAFISGTAMAACPTGTNALGTVQGKEACGLQGTYLSDLALSNDKLWVLQGGVFIGGDNTNNAKLSIQAGAKIIGQSGADFLVITRGSKILAEGTKNAPIVFTASKSEGRNRGEWGGLIINGNAPINSCKVSGPVCQAQGEGSTGLYGGNDAQDNSGILRYVRVEFAGFEITPENELNGIAFQGVGAGTEVDYVQVHMNADDGVEFFGGTVNVKHVLLTGNKDDSMDWTSGWTGKAQYVIVEQYADAANNGIEADSNKDTSALPKSNPILANLTFIGTNSAEAKGGEGILLRRGTGAKIFNSVVTGFKKSCLDIDGGAAFEMAALGEIQFHGMVLDCATTFSIDADDPASVESFFNAGDNNMIASPLLSGYAPTAASPVYGNAVDTFDFDEELFFDFVDFSGAVESAELDWTKGWTTSAKN